MYLSIYLLYQVVLIFEAFSIYSPSHPFLNGQHAIYQLIIVPDYPIKYKRIPHDSKWLYISLVYNKRQEKVCLIPPTPNLKVKNNRSSAIKHDIFVNNKSRGVTLLSNT